MREVAIAGVGLSKFDRFDGEKGRPYKEFYEIGAEAVLNALECADMDMRDVQEAFSGSCYQGVGSGHRALAEVAVTGIPIVNVENACSSSASTFRLAYQTVAYGIYDIVLAIGFFCISKM